jgi:predicted nucleic acid-binding protein
MSYLVDASALIRMLREQVDPLWFEFEDRGLLSVCEPALVEALPMAPGDNYAATERFINRRYLPVTIPDGIWDMVATIRRELALHGAHRGASVADLVIAATAIRMKLIVLHEDADFETVARFIPELQQQRVSVLPKK